MHRVNILTFHGLGDPARAIPPEEQPMWVRAQMFEQMLDAIAGYDDVQITFDDGNASDIELAMPALKRRGLTASFFVLAGRLAQAGSLSAGDLRALRAGGMPIGVHGMHHRAWPELSGADLQEELVTARKWIEDILGESITQAACPFGAYNRTVLARLRECGYERVYSSDRGPARTDSWLAARNTIRATDTPETVRRLCQTEWPWQTRLKHTLKTAVKARL